VKRLFFFTAVLVPLMLSGAWAGDCTGDNATITEDNIRFSLTNDQLLAPVAFDDIGCALVFRDEQCGTDQYRFDSGSIVHDYYTEEAVPVKEALYVAGSGVETPGGHGILAFKDRESAERFISDRSERSEDNKGKVLTYEELLDTVE
jgi:hypothetical protein